MNNSSLFDEKTFYKAFLQDLSNSQDEVIIESPFITIERMKTHVDIFEQLISKGVKIYIVTRDPSEHKSGYDIQAEAAVQWCESVGIQVFLSSGNHHRKLAILDRKILWEGSLNILSQIKSREIMRRIESQETATEMFTFLNFASYLPRIS